MNTINDLLVYVLDPEVYDQQPFLGWDSEELRSLLDVKGKLVLDVGAGTGRLAFIAAEEGARAVFAVEPVANLREFMRRKAIHKGTSNLYPQDGIITCLPFPDHFVDVCTAGHVFGDDPE
jgi:ubiquinone/menaquinone biosynthesis C-methylase UbiE